MILGTGGQGRECLDIAQAMAEDGADLTVAGFLDDQPTAANRELVERRGYPIMGTLETFLKSPRRAAVCIGIGSGEIRARIDDHLRLQGIPSPVLVHPSVTLGSAVVLGPGTVLWAGVRLTTNIRIGRHVHLNQNVTIGHDVVLEDFVSVNPVAAISGHVRLGAASTVGAGAVVLQGLQVGSRAIVGAGGVVVRAVSPHATVKGVPAK